MEIFTKCLSGGCPVILSPHDAKYSFDLCRHNLRVTGSWKGRFHASLKITARSENR